MTKLRVAVICASIRQGRQSHRVAIHLVDRINAVEGFDAHVVDLKTYALPLWEETYLGGSGHEDEMHELKDKLDAIDAFLFVSPEYNGSYTPALKNLVDFYPRSSFADSAIGVVTISTGKMGGMRAALSMQQLILALSAYPQPEMLLCPFVDKTFDEEGKLIDPDFDKVVSGFLKSFGCFSRVIRQLKQDKRSQR